MLPNDVAQEDTQIVNEVSEKDNQDEVMDNIAIAISEEDLETISYMKLKASDRKEQKSYYELTFIIRHDASSKDIFDYWAKLSSFIKNGNGVVHKMEYWGLRTLKYKIKKNRKAHFYSTQFEGNADMLVNMEKSLRTSELVIRHIIIRIAKIRMIPTPMTHRTEDVSSNKLQWDDEYIITI